MQDCFSFSFFLLDTEALFFYFLCFSLLTLLLHLCIRLSLDLHEKTAISTATTACMHVFSFFAGTQARTATLGRLEL
jgi:hypothetical protein